MATLYIHIPFCKRICSYCDFYKVGAISHIPQVVEMLHREMEERANYVSNRHLTSIYFGGGTPSLINPKEIEGLISHADKLFDCSAVEEITIEANPDDLTKEYVSSLASTPVNRVSLGIQSFDDEALRFMNRRHTSTEAIDAVHRLRNAGFRNISLDIIFGIAGFGDRVLKHSVEQLIALKPEHISAYHLIVEEQTRLGIMTRRGKYTPIDDLLSEQEYLMVHHMLTEAGYEHYEVSNYSKAGFRARHNSSYWQGVEYLGLGPGAHSFSTDNRTWCTSTVKEYATGVFKYEDEHLTQRDHLNEYVMTSLRCCEGIDLATIEQRFGSHERQRILRCAQSWLDSGALLLADNHLFIPTPKMLISDAIIETLFE